MSVMTFPSHHSPQQPPMLTQQPHQHHGNQLGGTPMMQDWLKAWRSWAGTRKRGKMAQFIVQKLENSKQARWIDITIGKFELTEWHNIAEEWFKEKPRSSDQVDAPCMLRKGLPRAFPGLEEVKTESIKEGTQYRSRVFQATPALVQEVQLYVNKPTGGYPNGTVTSYYNPQPNLGNGYMSTSSGMAPPTSQFLPATSMYQGGYSPSMEVLANHQQSLKMKSSESYNPSPMSMPSPGSAHVKVENTSPYSNHSPYSNPGGGVIDLDIDGSPSESTSQSASPYTGYLNGGGGNPSPGVSNQIVSDAASYDNQTSPYSMNGSMSPGGGPYSYGSVLQVPPTSADGIIGNDWVQSSTPSYSPEPNFQPNPSPPVDMTHHHVMNQVLPPMQQPPQQQALLEVKTYPDQSPLEGGGKLALVFGGQLPPGRKWLSFNSQQRPEYIHQVEALEENPMTLTTIIPKHDIPENVTLEVIMSSGQVVAQTDFTYYANAQYNSDLLFQYLVQNFPSYFPEVGGSMEGMGPEGTGGIGGNAYSSGYYDNIPSTSYNLLLGSCRLGIEELVFATLQLPSMLSINTEQLRKAQSLCEEHNHSKLAEILQVLVDLLEITPRSDEDKQSVLASKEARKALSRLDNSSDAEDGGMKIMSRLIRIHKMDQRTKFEEEREQQVPSSPTIQPASPVPAPDPEKASGLQPESSGGLNETTGQRRRSSTNKLQRQPQSVRDDDELSLPVEIHSRTSIAETDDQLPPLRPVVPTRRGGPGPRRILISTYSDAADSAVSMSFDKDNDYEQEVARRNSASLALSGLYSLNMSSFDGSAVNINIDPEAGYTFASALQYECLFQVTDDYPPQSDATSVIFKAGDRIIQIGDVPVRGKGPDDFAELLQTEAVKGTSVRIVPRVSPPPTTSSINSSIGYSSLDVSTGRSEQHLVDSITMKVSNLLSMKGSGFKRSVTLRYSAADKGFGFKFIGGNIVGLFVSEVKAGRKELQVGDRILEIAGRSAVEMSHYEASEIIAQAKDTLQLKVTQNAAKYKSIRDQFEFESFYIRVDVDHTPSDSKDMTLNKGSLVRVVNSVLYPDSWLAWSVDETTGIDMELRRIPSPTKAYQQFGKHVYQSVAGPQDVMVS